ncbi:MAG: WG repeat-containing protein, partial [Bacteroidota bacterium]
SGCRNKIIISKVRKGKYLLYEEFEYDSLKTLVDGFVKAKKNNLYGVVNKKNEEVIPIAYDKITTEKDRFALVYKADKVGLFDITGKPLIPMGYDTIDIQFYYERGDISPIFLIKKDNRWGVLDYKYEILIPMIYDQIELFYSRFFRVKKDGKFGLITREGEIIEKLEYEKLDFSSGRGKIFYNAKKSKKKISTKYLENIQGEISVKKLN